MCSAPRLPSEYPHPLRLSSWEAFRFNVGVMRAARRWRRHEISEANGKMEGDDFGIGMIKTLLTEALARR